MMKILILLITFLLAVMAIEPFPGASENRFLSANEGILSNIRSRHPHLPGASVSIPLVLTLRIARTTRNESAKTLSQTIRCLSKATTHIPKTLPQTFRALWKAKALRSLQGFNTLSLAFKPDSPRRIETRCS